MGVARTDRAEFWRKHVEALITSDLGIREYCRKHGLREGPLYNWRRRFAAKAKAAPKALQLVPVQVVKSRGRSVEASFQLTFPEIGSVAISGDYGAVVRLLQVLRWEAI